jgi:hypothetical protein
MMRAHATGIFPESYLSGEHWRRKVDQPPACPHLTCPTSYMNLSTTESQKVAVRLPMSTLSLASGQRVIDGSRERQARNRLTFGAN